MLANIDRLLLRAFHGMGLETFDAMFYRRGESGGSECVVTRDTLELQNEYGVSMVQSGARLGYLLPEVGQVSVGDWFEIGTTRFVVENRESSQDSGWRFVHCRVEDLTGG